MGRKSLFLLALFAGCSRSPDVDLQYVKQARSLAAEWALVNEKANAGLLTDTYADSMRQWVRTDLRTAYSSITRPDQRYGAEMRALLAEPRDAAPAELRAHADALKRIEDGLESA